MVITRLVHVERILLNYNNYYVDRRIIDDQFLYTGSNSPNKVANPETMNKYTLGSVSTDTGANSYYTKILSLIPGGATVNQAKNALKSMLSTRNVELAGALDYSVSSLENGLLDMLFGNSIPSSPIKELIDDGRPPIITMASYLGGPDHFVIGYGYHNIGQQLGYVTHFGWGEKSVDIWVNSAWCDGYIGLKIDSHAHDYEKINNLISGTTKMEYKCKVCGYRKLDVTNLWVQPRFTNNNTYGTLVASGAHSNEQPWRAYNGTLIGGGSGSGDNWSAKTPNGWLLLRLESFIIINQIEFYSSAPTSSDNRTKDGKFTGRGGVELGKSFTVPNRDYSRVIIDVPNVLTDCIQLNISSSYDSYIDAGMIIIHATIPTSQPTRQTWSQPIWTSNTNAYGTIKASGYYSNEQPWKAYNGTLIAGGSGSGDLWSVNAKSGWLELKLDYPIYIQKIEIWSDYSTSSSNRTKNFYFSGNNGILGNTSYEFANINQAYVCVNVGGIWTNVITYNPTSSYGNYVGASRITITALI